MDFPWAVQDSFCSLSQIHVLFSVDEFLSFMVASLFSARARNVLFEPGTSFDSAGGVCELQRLARPSETPTTRSRIDTRMGLGQRLVDRSVVPPRASSIARRRCHSPGGRRRWRLCEFPRSVSNIQDRSPGSGDTTWAWESVAHLRRDYLHNCGLGHLRSTCGVSERGESDLLPDQERLSVFRMQCGPSQKAINPHLLGSRGAFPHRSDAGCGGSQGPPFLPRSI